uniref:Phosphatidylinositol 4-phosphate 5-kinase type-1 gamma (Trinotate prediction) n=1 Tax=Henneguya salminicola TaxID=69463 RepID=A0A6G3MJ94_HENSL
MNDLRTINIYYFPSYIFVFHCSSGSIADDTPAHNFNDFRFRDFAPLAFQFFRNVYGIKIEDFIMSLCNKPMKELSRSGASGSLFFKSSDDLYVVKTVDHREAKFLQGLLPGYYMNCQQNKNTLLPKFFGLYLYSVHFSPLFRPSL